MTTGFLRFLRRRDGGVLVETAVIMPILMMLLLGGFEVGRYFLVGQKLQRAAMTVADLASRTEVMNAGDLDDLFAAAREVARPFALEADARVVVTSVVRPADGGDPVVEWQRASGSGAWASAVGVEGGTAAIADPNLIKAGHSIIIAEAAFIYRPVLFDDMTTQTLTAEASFRPRFSRKVTLE
ncbi:MAG: pilus assembly protein [Marivibrio sp.]|uniref:TadE/TadG family type IV pilus assembly protein n=1 Tax=Marivibrio sp. TaxID=2039719 RepID=UPI0032EE56E5